MKAETKQNTIDLIGYVLIFAITMAVWAAGCNWVNSVKEKKVKHTTINGQRK